MKCLRIVESVFMWCVLGTVLYFALILARLFWQPYVVIAEPNPSILTLEVSFLVFLVAFIILEVARLEIEILTELREGVEHVAQQQPS